ncbi:MAG: thioredoxin family protein [Bacteroidota bacterium]
MKRVLMSVVVLIMAAATFAQEGYKVGDVARDFSLKNIDGNMVSLADYEEAKGFIVVFTCNHCPYAIKYEDRINALNKKYAAKGYPVIAINPNDVSKVPDDSFDNMKIRAKEKGFTFPYLVDGTSEIAATYGATRTPHAYVLQKQGKELKVAYIGAIDDNARDASSVEETYLANAIDLLLEGKKVEKSFTRAIGCTIKWPQ